MIDSTAIATPPESIKSRNSNFSVQIQIKPRSEFEFALRDTEKPDLVDFGDVVFSVETVIELSAAALIYFMME